MVEEETDQFGRKKFKLPVKQPAAPRQPPKPSIKPKERKHLEPVNREFKPESQLGKTFTMNAESIKASQICNTTSQNGFYCETCNCSMKDSQAWYDHINGKKHNQMLGMSMVVEKVSVDRVKARLAGLKRNRKEATQHREIIEKAINQQRNESASASDQEIELKMGQPQKRQRINEEESKEEQIEASQGKPENGAENQDRQVKDEEQGCSESAQSDVDSLDEEAQLMAAMGLPVDFQGKNK